MKCTNCLVVTSAIAVACVAGALAFAQQEKPSSHAQPQAKPQNNPHAAAPAGQPEMKLPPGWTAEDMAKCTAAGIPGEQHAFLNSHNGTWHGKEQMWMGPGTEAMTTTCTAVAAPVYNGHFNRVSIESDMPGMGPFQGELTTGYDNTTGKYTCSWIDSMGTTMMTGTGAPSADKKTMTWTYNFTCPITNKPATMRQVDSYVSENEMVMEMFANDPKSGKEYKMLHIDYTKK